MVITLVSYHWGLGSISRRSPLLATMWHITPVHGHPLGMVSAPLQGGYTTSTTKPVVFGHVLQYIVDNVVRHQISSPGGRKKVPHQDLEASIELYQTRYVLVASLWLWCMGGQWGARCGSY